jgi:hypothetical protein
MLLAERLNGRIFEGAEVGVVVHPASELRPAMRLFNIRRGVPTVDSSVDLNTNLRRDLAVAISRLLAQARVV